MSLPAELWRFLRIRKKFWLLPIMVMVFIFAALVIFGEGSALAPFIYSLF